MENTETPTQGHMLDLDQTSGNEFIASGGNFLSDEGFFMRNVEEEKIEHIYNQKEFASEYWNSLCTIYGPITALSSVVGREITKDERLEMVQIRFAQKDFQKDQGGYVTVGIDVMRNWWNKKYPDDQIVTFMVGNKEPIRREFFAKGLPLVSSFRGNREYSVDSLDGKLNNIDYWKYPKTYGHCVTYFQLRKIDNYNREYSFKSVDDYYKLLEYSIEWLASFAIFRMKDLNERGQAYVAAMKAKIWNGERADEYMTRKECSLIVKKISWNKILESQIWDMKRPNDVVTRYEASVMLKIATHGKISVDYTDKKDLPRTRGEVILLAMKK